MTVININPCDRMKEGAIGHVRENEVTQIVFDLSAWIAKYGLGTVALSVMRQGDLVPYPVPIAIVDGKATWTISATDTAKHGRIKAQLSYMVGTKVKKTNVYTLSTKESLPVDGDAPEAYETWLEILQTMTAETAANAESARQSAASAGQSASDAEQSMQDAQGCADDASASARSASADADTAEAARDTARTYANNAQASATSAQTSASQASTSASTASAAATSASASAASAYADAERAEQAAATSGYLWFYIEDGKLYMDRTANTQVDFFMRDGKLYVEEGA